MGKSMKSGRSRVAGQLLWLVLALSSCLLPQNDDPLPVIPKQANRPPRIDPDRVSPPRFFNVNVGTNCSPPTVQAYMTDLDVSDRIRIRWLVYREDGTPDRQPPIDQSIVGGSLPTRPVISPPPSVFSLTLLNSTGKGRRLELVVSDGEFSTDLNDKLITLPVEDGIPLPDGGTIDNPSYLDTYTWVVDTINESCPP